jgi:predicted Zn-dependent protease
MDPGLRERLLEAEQLLTRALDGLGDRDPSPGGRGIRVNRSAARSLLGDHAGALRDVDAVLDDEPENEWALRNKGILLIASDRADEAVGVLEAIRDPTARQQVAAPLAEAYRAAGHVGAARAVLQQLWDNAPTPERLGLALRRQRGP